MKLFRCRSYGFGVALLMAVLTSFRAIQAEPTLKALVLEDCARAKEKLAMTNPAELGTVVEYLVEVLNLKTSELLPLLQPPPLPPKFTDLNPSKIEPARVDPLNVVDPEIERRARRCAVNLLGTIGAAATGAIPELVRYGAQGELDDLSRNLVHATLVSIASQGASQVSVDVVERLVQALTGEGKELSHTVLVLLSEVHREYILSSILAQEAIPVSLAISVVQDLSVTTQTQSRDLLLAALADSGPRQVRALALIKELGWGDIPFSPQMAQLLLDPNPGPQELVAHLFVSGRFRCGSEVVDIEQFRGLLNRDDVIGDAAAWILGCSNRSKEIPFQLLQAYARSPVPAERRHAANILGTVVAYTKERIGLLSDLVNDNEIPVSKAAAVALRAYSSIRKDDVAAVYLKFLKRITADSASVFDFNRARIILEELPALAPLSIKASWVSLIEDLAVALARSRGLELLSDEELRIFREAILAIGSGPTDIPARILKHKVDSERFLAAQLLADMASSQPRFGTLMVDLLADNSSIVRAFAIRTLSANLSKFSTVLRSASASKNLAKRSISALLLLGTGESTSSAALSLAQVNSAAEWLKASPCSEFFTLFTDGMLGMPELRSVAVGRVVECLAAWPGGNSGAVASALHAVRTEQQQVDEIFTAAVERKLGMSTILVLAGHSADLGLTIDQKLQLISLVLTEGGTKEVFEILPVIQKGGEESKPLIPLLKQLAEKSEESSRLRCRLLGAISFVDPNSFDFKDIIREEMDEDPPGSSCLGDLEPRGVQSALIALLNDAPIRRRSKLLRRVPLIAVLEPSEELMTVLSRDLSAESAEVQCQATWVALTTGITVPQLEFAFTHSLYGECWRIIRQLAGNQQVVELAQRCVARNANSLEVARATELLQSRKN